MAELTSWERLVSVSAPVFDAEQPPDGSVVPPIWEHPYVVTWFVYQPESVFDSTETLIELTP